MKNYLFCWVIQRFKKNNITKYSHKSEYDSRKFGEIFLELAPLCLPISLAIAFYKKDIVTSIPRINQYKIYIDLYLKNQTLENVHRRSIEADISENMKPKFILKN